MKTTNEYLQILRNYMHSRAAEYGITHMGIFGSVARKNESIGNQRQFTKGR